MAPSRHDHALKIPVRHQIANTQTYKLFISHSRHFFATNLCVWYLLRHGRLNNFPSSPQSSSPTTICIWIYIYDVQCFWENCWGEIEKRHTIQMCWKLTSFIFVSKNKILIIAIFVILLFIYFWFTIFLFFIYETTLLLLLDHLVLFEIKKIFLMRKEHLSFCQQFHSLYFFCCFFNIW